jgi:hypothetical protein
LGEVVDEILAAARAGQTVDVAKWTAARRLAAGRHEAVKGGTPDAA